MEDLDRTTTTNQSAGTITSADIIRAVKLLREASKQPFITCIKSKYEWWKLLQKSNTARNFSLYGGIPCYRDDEVPPTIVRFEMSDGTHTDVPMNEEPFFLRIDSATTRKKHSAYEKGD